MGTEIRSAEMTWEKAIEVLNTYDMSEDNEDTEFKDALRLAIDSLKHYKGAYIQQLRAERNIAIEQLEKLGYSLGEKIEPCKDAVSRQAVITVAKDWWGNGVMAIDDIYKLPPVEPTRKWIPVSERLPEERGVYIVTEKVFSIDDMEHTGRFNLMTEPIEFHNKWLRARFYEVIAWMPLPKPYNAEMESEE